MLERAAIIRGTAAEIRWAYYIAAGVEGWALRPPRKDGPQVWTLSARLVGSDAFKMAQRPLLFVTQFGKGRSVWPIERFQMTGDQLTATLGRREDY
jgi:hypothetical protein